MSTIDKDTLESLRSYYESHKNELPRDSVYPGGVGQFDQDQDDCIEAYLSEHLPDDDEPITAEWVRSIAPAYWNIGKEVYWPKQGLRFSEPIGDNAGGFYFDPWVGQVGSVSCVTYIPVKTRGQVRLLLRAVGIESNTLDISVPVKKQSVGSEWVQADHAKIEAHRTYEVMWSDGSTKNIKGSMLSRCTDAIAVRGVAQEQSKRSIWSAWVDEQNTMHSFCELKDGKAVRDIYVREHIPGDPDPEVVREVIEEMKRCSEAGTDPGWLRIDIWINRLEGNQ